MIDEDLDALLEDHGLPCTCNGISFLGIKDMPDEDIGSGTAAQSTQVTLFINSIVVTSAGIKKGTPINVNGIAYMARNPELVDDGAFTRIPLTAV